jgi:hypothetical protein
MRKHQRTKVTVSTTVQSDDFHPSDALESLHAAVLRVETIVRVASEAVDRLHGPRNPAGRRTFARMQILVGKAAQEASAALAHGDKLMAALASHLQTRRAQRDLGPPRVA